MLKVAQIYTLSNYYIIINLIFSQTMQVLITFLQFIFIGSNKS